MKLIETIKSSIDKHPLRTGLQISWLLFSVFFITFSYVSWIGITNHYFLQLEAMNSLVSKSTRQHASSLFHQVDKLENRLHEIVVKQLSLEDFFLNDSKDRYDHSFLIDKEGRFLYTSLRESGSIQIDLHKTIISQQTMQRLTSKNKPSFAPTISLGNAHTSQYVPICRPTKVQYASLVCIALSINNSQLSFRSNLKKGKRHPEMIIIVLLRTDNLTLSQNTSSREVNHLFCCRFSI